MKQQPVFDPPRPCRPDELAEVIGLLDRVFRADGASSMGTEFPVFLSKNHCAGLWIIKEGGRIVAHAGVDYVTLDVEGAAVRLGMIGAVATDEAYRGNGLASQLLDAIDADARGRGVGVHMISGGRRLYTRRGARPAGAIPQYRVPAAVFRTWSAPSVEWRAATADDAGPIMRWYEPQNPRFSRREDDIAKIVTAQCCGQHTRIALDAGMLAGYAVFTVSRDAVHVLESGGGEACVPAFARFAPDGFEGKLVVSLTCRHPLRQAFERLIEGVPGIERVDATFGGTAQWVDFPACIEQLQPYWQRHGLPGMKGEETTEGLRLTDGTDDLTLALGEMVEVFWGAPQGPKVPVPPSWRPVLPVPIRMYGLNYI